ncbi:MAG: ribonuclease P protein component [Allomuricauda sp.]|nr:MAG: ribonuclease P protein component [Allomuricauda sp.]
MSKTLSKNERLKSQKQIELLFLKGSAITKFPFKLIYLPNLNPEDFHTKAGFVVPKKNFKSAVKRNRIKRLLREAYRRNKAFYFNNIEGKYALMILYLGRDVPSFEVVENGTKQLLVSFLEKISHEKN